MIWTSEAISYPGGGLLLFEIMAGSEALEKRGPKPMIWGDFCPVGRQWVHIFNLWRP